MERKCRAAGAETLMKARSFTLLEVMISLALLSILGVSLMKLQAAAVRQCNATWLRVEAARRVEDLLWSWSSTGTAITLPATGRFDNNLCWQRSVTPVRIASGVIPNRITVRVSRSEETGETKNVYRLDWLVPRQTGERKASGFSDR